MAASEHHVHNIEKIAKEMSHRWINIALARIEESGIDKEIMSELKKCTSAEYAPPDAVRKALCPETARRGYGEPSIQERFNEKFLELIEGNIFTLENLISLRENLETHIKEKLLAHAEYNETNDITSLEYSLASNEERDSRDDSSWRIVWEQSMPVNGCCISIMPDSDEKFFLHTLYVSEKERACFIFEQTRNRSGEYVKRSQKYPLPQELDLSDLKTKLKSNAFQAQILLSIKKKPQQISPEITDFFPYKSWLSVDCNNLETLERCEFRYTHYANTVEFSDYDVKVAAKGVPQTASSGNSSPGNNRYSFANVNTEISLDGQDSTEEQMAQHGGDLAPNLRTPN